jgi:hypothetical protein
MPSYVTTQSHGAEGMKAALIEAPGRADSIQY